MSILHLIIGFGDKRVDDVLFSLLKHNWRVNKHSSSIYAFKMRRKGWVWKDFYPVIRSYFYCLTGFHHLSTKTVWIYSADIPWGNVCRLICHGIDHGTSVVHPFHFHNQAWKKVWSYGKRCGWNKNVVTSYHSQQNIVSKLLAQLQFVVIDRDHFHLFNFT